MSQSELPLAPQSPAHQNIIDALTTQLTLGPDLSDVAAVLLRQSLKKLYPELDIDPSITMVGTPSWEIVDDEILAGPIQYQALTEILAHQTVFAVPALYIEGEHFLVQQPITEPAIHLPVRIDEIATIINLLAPVMLTAFQEQQLEFWNQARPGSGPRWHELSNILRSFWNVDEVTGWSKDDCNMARTLFRTPDLSTLKDNNPYQCKAYLLSIDLVDGGVTSHLNRASIAVLVGTHQNRTVILTHSLLKGYEKFATLEQLGATLPDYVKTMSYQEIRWRLDEQSGNLFEQQACELVSAQVDVIGSIDFSNLRHTRSIKQPIAPNVDGIAPSAGPGLEWFKDALPDWLDSASLPDLNNFSRHLKDLAVLHSQNAGKTYLDGILPIKEYALDELRTEMSSDYPDADQLDLATLEFRVQSPVIWGTFVVPGKIDTFIFSFAELALQNLIALPTGNKFIQSTNGKPLPAWLTVEYVEGLISKADIGSTYPALIKSLLLDDAKDSARRQTLYTQHLRIQLPLLALQCKIRGEAGIDARGYRYVVAVMETEMTDRVVEGQTIVMRPLAFIPLRRKDGSQDEVANMFVIGPMDPTAGPCLLYRPMLDEPLTQYPSPSNLLYAIQQSASLRESVLAWLPDDIRGDYANYVFPGSLPSPWSIVEYLVDSEKLTTMTGPMVLGEKALEGDLFEALFKANTNALVELADRQSVSNAESRWESFKRAGWMGFNLVLPFLGRTIGIGAWIWQIMDQLQDLHEAQANNDQQAQWAALADVLLNLGMAITLHVSTQGAGKRLANNAPKSEPAITKVPAPAKVNIKQLDNRASPQSSDLQQTLNITGALNQTRASLKSVLDRFKINQPAGLGTANTEAGPYRHLYGFNQKWYAPVGQDWFEVSVDDDGTVTIINSAHPTRSGPALINNNRGQWFVDTRLRLRGGGSTRRIKSAMTQASRKAAELRTKLAAFESRKMAMQTELQQARQAMTDATPETVQAKRQLYLQKLESQQAEYAAALQDLKTLHVFSPTADYQQKSLGYLKAQLELIHAGMQEMLITFTPKMRTVLAQIERQTEDSQDRHIEDARQMDVMIHDMITRLNNTESRDRELRDFGKEGLRLIQRIRERQPTYGIDDLKSLQITMARNLCLPESTLATTPDAWSSLDKIIDSADMAVQVLRDTLDERSVARIDERIDALNNLIEQFNVIDERLLDFKRMCAERVLETPLARLRQQLDQFKNRAAHNLVQVLEERDALRARPSLPVQRPRPNRKFIRTYNNGVLIGQPRLTPQGLETEFVDITSPITEKIIATYHRKPSGVWAEYFESVTANATPDLQASINEGQTLLDELPAFNKRMTEQLKQPHRSPAGIEYLFQQHATLLARASSRIEQSLTEKNETEDTESPAATVNKALFDAAEDLFQQATSNMLKMTKEQPPTLSGIEWLKNKQAISISKTITRRRLKGGKTQYLDEYAIRDQKSRETLWYAHFLYSTSWVPAKSFLYGRLKTPKEQSLGLSADTPQGLNESQQLDYYRSMIGLEQAEQLFFNVSEDKHRCDIC
ncbi:TPA: hypothetical protein SAN82_001572 [Pseudomonas putida]|nr:hypothetical protein [Pseudomonas putida]